MASSTRPIVVATRTRGRNRTALGLWVWVLGSCVGMLVATYMIFVEAPPPRKIVIASGGQNGGYFRYAKKYAEDLQKGGLAVEVRETAGSVENLKLLGQDNSGVTVAIIQSGLASAEDLKTFYALGSLYREPLWVFYRSDKPISRLGQLAGKRIGLVLQGVERTPSPCNCLQSMACSTLNPQQKIRGPCSSRRMFLLRPKPYAMES